MAKRNAEMLLQVNSRKRRKRSGYDSPDDERRKEPEQKRMKDPNPTRYNPVAGFKAKTQNRKDTEENDSTCQQKNNSDVPGNRGSVASPLKDFRQVSRSEEHTSELQSPMYLVC